MHLYLICFITNFIFLYVSHWSTKKHKCLLNEHKYTLHAEVKQKQVQIYHYLDDSKKQCNKNIVKEKGFYRFSNSHNMQPNDILHALIQNPTSSIILRVASEKGQK